MIRNTAKREYFDFSQGPVLSHSYEPIMYYPFLWQHLSEVAQITLRAQRPRLVTARLDIDRPEIIALRILDFLSCRKGFIRRKAHNFRNETFYTEMFGKLVTQITNKQLLVFSSACVSVNLPNQDLVGSSLYPHMGSYLAFENIHKIAVGLRQLYPTGVQFVLGFESFLYQDVYALEPEIVQHAFEMSQQLNILAYQIISKEYGKNPVHVVDARFMAARSFGSYDTFLREVDKRLTTARPTPEWLAWYRTTIPPPKSTKMVSSEARLSELATWRAAVGELKYDGGTFDGGFVGYSSEAIPFTPSGRRTNMFAFQLVPQNDCLPHQRVMSYHPTDGRWRLQAYQTLVDSSAIYEPRFVAGFAQQFYFEMV